MIEKKSLPFELKKIKEEADYFTFEGYASTFGTIDYGNDRILPGAFKKTIRERKKDSVDIENEKGEPTGYKNILPSFWQHDTHQPIAAITSLKEDEHGLPIEGVIPKADGFASSTIIPQMRLKNIRKMSIGYRAKSFEIVTEKIKGREERIRDLKEIKLYEISLVSFPMNDDANITAIKTATPYENLPLGDVKAPWSKVEAVKRIKVWANATDTPNERYRRAFFWYDSENPQDFGSYKFPFADVVKGRLVAMPRGVFAAAGALNGARSTTTIPESDQEKIKGHINKYYDKMDRPSPFKSNTDIFKIDDFSVLNERDVENLLMSGICLNLENSKILIRCLKQNDCLYREDIDNAREEQEKLNNMVSQLQKFTNNLKGE